VEPVFTNIGNDADNLARRVFKLRTQSFPDYYALAHGFLVWPILLRHRLINNDDFRGSPLVLLREHSSFANRNRQCRKVMRSDKTPIDIAVVTITTGRWFAFDGKGQIDAHADHRSSNCRRSTEHAGNTFHLLDHSPAKLAEGCVGRVTR